MYKSRPKIFFSQPMKDKTKEEISKEREQAISELYGLFRDNFDVVDSVFDFEDVENVNKDLYYLSKSLELLSTADYAVFLNGWHKSRGCLIEKECCDKYGIETIILN